MKLFRISTRKLLYILAALWTVVILGIAVFTSEAIYSNTVALSLREAKMGYTKDVMMRSWASMHGGVYVPVTAQTQPVPYLENIPERDILTPSGRKLTLLNPAFITRQNHELSFKLLGIRGHITSLNPMRKENSSDKWETEALKSFQKGNKEVFGIDAIDNEKYFRYMTPLLVEESCLKCHAIQGQRVAEIRGGISSSIPWKPYETSISNLKTKVWGGFFLLWVLGIAAGTLIVKSKEKP